MKFAFALLLLSINFISTEARSVEIYERHRNARALGMGNAYTAIASDDESFFYNPAGIGANTAFIFNIFDVSAGINGTDALDDLADLMDTATASAAVDNLYGAPVWAGAGAKASVMVPFFAAAIYYDVDASLLFQNPAATELQMNYVIDQGYAVGTGFSTGFFEFGIVGKRIDRKGFSGILGPGDLADVVGGTGNLDDVLSNIQGSGIGYGIDMGMNFTFPGPVSPILSFVWKDIGDTSFRTGTVGGIKPPKQEQEMVVGAALDIDLWLASATATIDFKHLENDDEQIPKKIHMGLEVGIPFIDLRVGLHQGYLSYGAGFGMGPLQIDAALWSVEMGEWAGQLEDKRYLVQASIKFGFDPGVGFTTGAKKGETAKALEANGGGSASGSSSRRGSRRGTKVRR